MNNKTMNLKEKDLQQARNILETRHIEDPFKYIQSLLSAYDLLNCFDDELQNHQNAVGVL